MLFWKWTWLKIIQTLQVGGVLEFWRVSFLMTPSVYLEINSYPVLRLHVPLSLSPVTCHRAFVLEPQSGTLCILINVKIIKHFSQVRPGEDAGQADDGQRGSGAHPARSKLMIFFIFDAACLFRSRMVQFLSLLKWFNLSRKWSKRHLQRKFFKPWTPGS